MNKKKFEKLLSMVSEAKDIVTGDEDVVVKTIKLKPEWKKNFDAIVECKKEIARLEHKKDALHRIAWAKVEQDTEIYAQMRYDHENGVIKVIDDSKEEE